MEKVKNAINTGDLKKALDILVKEKGICINHLCRMANINSSLIYRYVNNSVKSIGLDKKQALIETIIDVYLD